MKSKRAKIVVILLPVLCFVLLTIAFSPSIEASEKQAWWTPTSAPPATPFEQVNVPIAVNGCALETIIVSGLVEGLDNDIYTMFLGEVVYEDDAKIYFTLSPDHSPVSNIVDDEYNFVDIACGTYVLLAYEEYSGGFYIWQHSFDEFSIHVSKSVDVGVAHIHEFSLVKDGEE